MLKVLRTYYRSHRAACLFLLFAFIVYSFFVVYKFLHFAYNDWDMAFYNQSLWNLLHGRLYSELYALKPWGAHAEFLIDLTAPLLWIVPHPLTFTFVQLAFFILSGWLFYLMAQEDLDRPAALLLTVAYVFFAPNILALCHDHNAESLSPFFVLLAVYLFRKRRTGYYFVSLVLLLLVKENMAFVVAMLGIWGLLARDRNRLVWGMLPLSLAIVYLLLVYAWIIPFFRGGPYTVWARYAYLGSNKKEIIINLLRLDTWRHIISNPLNQNFLLSLFSVFLLPAFLSPGILLLMLPIFGYHLISAFIPEKTLLNVYALSMTPAIFLATVYTLKKYQFKGILLWSLCALMLIGCGVQIGQLRMYIAQKIGFVRLSHNDVDKWRMVNKIPRDASVIATFEFMPALSLREGLYSFHKVFSREFQDQERMKAGMFYVGQGPFKVPEFVNYALINWDDEWVVGSLRQDQDYVEGKIDSFLENWDIIDSSGSVQLLIRHAKQ